MDTKREIEMTEAEWKALAKWALCGKTGTSSMTMARHLAGIESSERISHPHDGGDFGRCLGLLSAVPSFRKRLGEMAEVSPYWAALVKNWSAIEAAKGDAQYNLMKRILDPIMDADRNVVRLGKGASIWFGK